MNGDCGFKGEFTPSINRRSGEGGRLLRSLKPLSMSNLRYASVSRSLLSEMVLFDRAPLACIPRHGHSVDAIKAEHLHELCHMKLGDFVFSRKVE